MDTDSSLLPPHPSGALLGPQLWSALLQEELRDDGQSAQRYTGTVEAVALMVPAEPHAAAVVPPPMVPATVACFAAAPLPNDAADAPGEDSKKHVEVVKAPWQVATDILKMLSTNPGTRTPDQIETLSVIAATLVAGFNPALNRMNHPDFQAQVAIAAAKACHGGITLADACEVVNGLLRMAAPAGEGALTVPILRRRIM